MSFTLVAPRPPRAAPNHRVTYTSADWALNLAAPHAGVPLLHFIASTLVGMLPYIAVTVRAGAMLSALPVRSEKASPGAGRRAPHLPSPRSHSRTQRPPTCFRGPCSAAWRPSRLPCSPSRCCLHATSTSSWAAAGRAVAAAGPRIGRWRGGLAAHRLAPLGLLQLAARQPLPASQRRPPLRRPSRPASRLRTVRGQPRF